MFLKTVHIRNEQNVTDLHRFLNLRDAACADAMYANGKCGLYSSGLGTTLLFYISSTVDSFAIAPPTSFLR